MQPYVAGANDTENDIESLNLASCFNSIAHFPYSYRKRDIEHLLRLTDSFTWEEQPTRDLDTGRLTKAGYIPLSQSLHNYIFGFGFAFHIIQSTVRIFSNHDMILTSWLPFDTSATPVYASTNIAQVYSRIYIGNINKIQRKQSYKKRGARKFQFE
jgi:hypothetical protein